METRDEIVVSIAQSLQHPKDIIGWVYGLIVRSFTDSMSDAVNCDGIIEINAESHHHTNPMNFSCGLILDEELDKC